MTEISADSAARLSAMLDKADNITIVTHMHPDGDALGSSIGLYHFLKMRGKQVRIVLNDRYPDSLGFILEELRSLSETKESQPCQGSQNTLLSQYGQGPVTIYEALPKTAGDIIRASELIICLDMNTFSRAEAMEAPLREVSCPKILIDHHLHPETESFDLIFSETEISSTAEYLYYILLSLPEVKGRTEALPKATLKALLTGMTTDTNNFANSVYPSTFRMASDLLAAGVDRDSIIAELTWSYRENRYRLLGELLKNRLHITPEGVAYTVIDKRLASAYDIKEGETEGFVNIPLGIKSVRMSLLLKEENDRYRVSIRSKKGTSANRFASEFFHGGGHENASGGRLFKAKDLSAKANTAEVSAYIEESIKKFMVAAGQ